VRLLCSQGTRQRLATHIHARRRGSRSGSRVGVRSLLILLVLLPLLLLLCVSTGQHTARAALMLLLPELHRCTF
jgi:hypothetical protein